MGHFFEFFWWMRLLRHTKTEKERWRAANRRRELQDMVGIKKKREERFQEQTRTKDRSGMRKPATTVRCALLNGSASRTEKKYMSRNKGMFVIFFGLGHRMRKDAMEEQFDKKAKHGWSFAADPARITDVNASSEDCKRTSGGVLLQLVATWEE